VSLSVSGNEPERFDVAVVSSWMLVLSDAGIIMVASVVESEKPGFTRLSGEERIKGRNIRLLYIKRCPLFTRASGQGSIDNGRRSPASS
jgi:hypothetical protein